MLHDISVYVLPNHFLSSCQWDISQEHLLPENFHGFHTIVGVVARSNHWLSYCIDTRNKRIYFLDSLGASPTKSYTDILQNIVAVKIESLEILDATVSFDLTPYGWTIVTSSNFNEVCKFQQPMQTKGTDCGIFVVLYNWYISFARKFDFHVDDMRQIRLFFQAALMFSTSNDAVIDAALKVNFTKWNLPLFASRLALSQTGNSQKRKDQSIQKESLKKSKDYDPIENIKKGVDWLKANSDMMKGKVAHPLILSMDKKKAAEAMEEFENRQFMETIDEESQIYEPFEFRFSSIEDQMYFANEMRDLFIRVYVSNM